MIYDFYAITFLTHPDKIEHREFYDERKYNNYVKKWENQGAKTCERNIRTIVRNNYKDGTHTVTEIYHILKR